MSTTYALLPVSDATYTEIYEKLEKAGYQHCFVRDTRTGEIRIVLGEVGLVNQGVSTKLGGDISKDDLANKLQEYQTLFTKLEGLGEPLEKLILEKANAYTKAINQNINVYRKYNTVDLDSVRLHRDTFEVKHIDPWDSGWNREADIPIGVLYTPLNVLMAQRQVKLDEQARERKEREEEEEFIKVRKAEFNERVEYERLKAKYG